MKTRVKLALCVSFSFVSVQACKPRAFNEEQSGVASKPATTIMAKEGNKGAMLWVDNSLSIIPQGRGIPPHIKPSQCWYYFETEDVNIWGPKGVGHFFEHSTLVNKKGVSPEEVKNAIPKSSNLQQAIGFMGYVFGMAVAGTGQLVRESHSWNSPDATPHFTKTPGGKLYAVTRFGEKLTEEEVVTRASQLERYENFVMELQKNPPPGSKNMGNYIELADGTAHKLRLSISELDIYWFRDVLKNERHTALELGKYGFEKSMRAYLKKLTGPALIATGAVVIGAGGWLMREDADKRDAEETLIPLIDSSRKSAALTVEHLKTLRDAVALVDTEKTGLNCPSAKDALKAQRSGR